MIQENIVKYFSLKKSMSIENSLRIHKKLEIFLENASKSEIPLTPTIEVDEAWHNFILHTKVYQEYCLSNFGQFVHHNPILSTNGVDCDAGDDEDEKKEKKCDSSRSKNFSDANLNSKKLAECMSGDDGGSSNCDSQVFANQLFQNEN